ncbi:hypothetical protein GP486_004549 [Trichoglossum hirsutum]|uniref:Methyltransferase type 11 domain-containing protein n=1 Tax=Trichoglossum hirsutum TaxID=265104 RepID=A0A9P8LAZ5_9PEZI|nr:hypothetical protein GP486_004549 [Trichoglossum hirsutum]
MASYNSQFNPPNRPGAAPAPPLQSSALQSGLRPKRSANSPPSKSNIPTPLSSAGRLKYARITNGTYDTARSGLQEPQTSSAQKEEKWRNPFLKPSATTVLDSASTTRPKTPSDRSSGFGFGSTSANATAGSGSSPEKARPTRNVLRRKPSSINQHSAYVNVGRMGSESSAGESSVSLVTSGSTSMPDGFKDPSAGSVFGIVIPSGSTTTSSIPSLSAAPRKRSDGGPGGAENLPSAIPQKPVTHDFPPPASLYNAHASSPSTRYSESPGPWSRTSTPTSMSSHSPGITQPTNLASRVRNPSPTRSRPPVTRWRTGSTSEEGCGVVDDQGLSSVRESLNSYNSSSSGSTVKGGDRGGDEGKEAKRRRRRLSPPPPSPPPRKSSQTFARKKSLHNVSEGSSSPMPSAAAAAAYPNGSQRALNVSSPPLGVGGHGEAPARPSREGTPNLGSQNRQAIPIIQSNLTGLQATSHKRGGSLGASGSLPTARKGSLSTETPSSAHPQARSAAPSRIPSRNPSPSPSHQSSHRVIPSLSHALGHSDESKDGKGHSSPSKRFGIFSRRPKPSPEQLATEKSEKSTRKVPAAGMGYEGYKKYTQRGRSGSTTSASGSFARSTSTSSAAGSNYRSTSSRKGSSASKSEVDVDGFLSDRLEPVILSSRGVVAESQRNGVNTAGSGGSQGSSGRRPSTGSSKNSSTQVSMRPKARDEPPQSYPAYPTVPSDPLPKPPLVKPLIGGDPVQAGDTEVSSSTPTLATRRSQHRSQLLSGKEPLKIPAPINTQAMAPSPSIESADAASQYSTPAFVPPEPSEDKDGTWLKPKKINGRPKSPRKWNFFQRAQTTTQKPPAVTEVPVTVARRPQQRQVAHYALLDGGDQEDGGDDLEAIMHEIEESNVSKGSPDHHAHSTSYTSELRRQEHVHSILLPDPPSLPPGLRNVRPSSPKVLLRPPQNLPPPEPEPPAEVPAKRSRLAQVGRIPRVVSTRGQQPSPQIFSRTLPARQGTCDHKVSPIAPQLNFDPVGSSRLVEWPDYTQVTGDLPEHHPTAEMKVSIAPIAPIAPVAPVAPIAPAAPAEEVEELPSPELTQTVRPEPFLTFSPRKMSDMSSSTSSGLINSAATTAVIPDPASALGEDEVWNEYDDLINDVLPPELHLSDKSSLGLPFQYASFADHGAQSRALVKESPTIGATTNPRGSLFPPKAFKYLSSPFGSPTRGSKISVMNSGVVPPTPMSFTDFFAGYGERNLSVIEPLSPFTSASHRRGASWDSPRSKPPSARESSIGDETQHRDSQQLTGFAEEKDGFGPLVNLRLAAMKTSKWLSFGRVLFSPAHMEVMQVATPPAGNRVLVLDGLGNDDWSYFCALTYPHATIYNLSPSPSSNAASTAMRRGSSTFQATENHRQIYHPDLDNPFPFPKGFFNAVVFRFPAVNSEAAYRFAISESKRVLRPGGYLEISVLDLDMMNMGNRTRRAVRTLKVKLHVEDDTLSLKAMSDSIQRMLGRRGYENLNRCMVGVPVAGKVADSRAGSLDEREVSYNNHTVDRRPQEDDGGITRLAPQVGRWWYTRCYESPLLPEDGDTSRSIWNDTTLLRECERKKTSFKLLICYAQKPLAPLRRTVSV